MNATWALANLALHLSMTKYKKELPVKELPVKAPKELSAALGSWTAGVLSASGSLSGGRHVFSRQLVLLVPDSRYSLGSWFSGAWSPI
jgi:hypothetical protein